MLLYVERQNILNGQFHRCFTWPDQRQLVNTSSRLIQRIDRSRRSSYGYPYFESLSIKVYCTPRCYSTKNWEVGYYQTYRISILAQRRLVSADFHLLQVIDQLFTYLQAVDIYCDGGDRFLLSGLELGSSRKRMPRWIRQIFRQYQSQSHHVYSLTSGFLELLRGQITSSRLSFMQSELELVRDRLFTSYSEGETVHAVDFRMRKLYQKMVGYLYGLVLAQIQQRGLVLRQFLRYQDAHPYVSR